MTCRCCREVDATRLARGFKTCAGCGAGGSTRGRKRYEALVAAGKCVVCTEPVTTLRTCDECRRVLRVKRGRAA